MTPAEVHALAVAAGLTHEQAITATAIAWAESDLNPKAIGDSALVDDTWGPSIGLWQVRSLHDDYGTGKERDGARLPEPAFNARAMVAISASGTRWAPWSVYKSGAYRRHLEAVSEAVEKEGEPMVVSRAEWGARGASGRTPAPNMTRGVGVHWLGPGAGRANHSQCAGHMREIQAFHMGADRGWADFAYNAAVCRHGYVFEGRGPRVRNAANGGGTRNGVDANAGWASILYIEGTDGGGLTDEARDGINDAAEWLGVAGGEWLGHRDFLSTECPGDEVYRWLHAGHPRSGGAPPPKPKPDPIQEEDMSVIVNRHLWLTGGKAVWFENAADADALVKAKTAVHIEMSKEGAAAALNISEREFRTLDEILKALAGKK